MRQPTREMPNNERPPKTWMNFEKTPSKKEKSSATAKKTPIKKIDLSLDLESFPTTCYTTDSDQVPSAPTPTTTISPKARSILPKHKISTPQKSAIITQEVAKPLAPETGVYV